VSIDLSRVTSLSDRFGNITQLELGGRVIWMLNAGSDKVILEVEKITSNTYAGETTYNNEQFILLDIYPKTNGIVTVTYGGLTKTITDTSGAEEPNAQKVYFGTFNGTSDSATTPASGELTIEGDYYAFGQGAWKKTSKSMNSIWQPCIKEVKNFGNPTTIPFNAFAECTKLTSVTIPKSVDNIGVAALGTQNPFYECVNLTELEVDSSNDCFCSENGALFSKDKTRLVAYPSVVGHYTIPVSVTSIDCGAFSSNITSVTVLSTTPPTLGVAVFGGTMEPYVQSITVPKGCGETYKAADGWSGYADLIVEAS
jgi:hypothetical protein